MTEKIVVARADIPTRAGRIYPLSMLRKMAESAPEVHAFRNITAGANGLPEMLLENAVATCRNFVMEGNTLYCDAEPLTINLEDMTLSDFHFHIVGAAQVDDQQTPPVVDDEYELYCVSAVSYDPYQGQINPAGQDRNQLVQELKHGSHTISFLKVNGEPREFECTLDPELMPEQALQESVQRPHNPHTLSVYMLGDQPGWRSFRVDSVISIL